MVLQATLTRTTNAKVVLDLCWWGCLIHATIAPLVAGGGRIAGALLLHRSRDWGR